MRRSRWASLPTFALDFGDETDLECAALLQGTRAPTTARWPTSRDPRRNERQQHIDEILVAEQPVRLRITSTHELAAEIRTAPCPSGDAPRSELWMRSRMRALARRDLASSQETAPSPAHRSLRS